MVSGHMPQASCFVLSILGLTLYNMTLFKRLFAKKEEEDYETVLSNLANDIQRRQLHLSEIRLRERRATLWATLYTLLAWAAYFVVWYLNALPRFSNGHHHNATVERVSKGVPILVGPIIILFIRRIVQIWYTRKGDAEEKVVQALRKQRREKVEEIKKKTNFYSTRDLLQKYDDGPAASPAALRHRFAVAQPQPPPVTPQRPAAQTKSNLQTPSSNILAQLSSPTMNYPVPPHKRWYDRLTDALLGDDGMEQASPSSRYALICEKCFAHNGLVKESMWEDAQYVCPKCGHFNLSAHAKKERARSGLSPSTSANSSPVATSNLIPPTNTQHQQSSSTSPSPGNPTRDLPSVDADESMSMEVDSQDNTSPEPLA